MSVINIISKLPTNPASPYKTRNLAGVDTIVIHQTDGSDKGVESAYSAARYHVDTKGWGGIAYHFFVTDDGKIYQTQDLETRSYHASSFNTRSIGIAITGKHRYDSGKTNEQIIGTVKYKSLVNSIVKAIDMLPNKDIRIVSHEEVSTAGKSDPNLDMNQLREDVKKKKSSSSLDDSSDSGDNPDTSSNVEDNKTLIKEKLDKIHDLTGEIKKLL